MGIGIGAGNNQQSGAAGQQVAAIQNIPGASNILSAAGLGGLSATDTSGANQALMQAPETQSVLGNLAGYAMSDADLAARFPGYVQSRNQYQNYMGGILGTPATQGGTAPQGGYDPTQLAAAKAAFTANGGTVGGANGATDDQIVGVYNALIQQGKAKGTQITQTGPQAATPGQTQLSMNQGNTLMNQGQSLIGSGQTEAAAGTNMQNLGLGQIQTGQGSYGTANNIISSGQGFLPQAQSIINQGQSFLPSAQSTINQGQALAGQAGNFLNPAASFAAGAQGIGQPDITLGQNLISGNQAIDPVVQQELMRAGLTSAAGSLGGAAALGGTAGQAAVGRNLGVGAENWVNQQRTMGQQLQQTGMGLSSGYAGAAGTLAGAGAGVAGAGAGLINAGSGVANAGSGIINAGTGVGGLGANLIGAGTGLYNAATGAVNAGTGMYGAGTGAYNAGVNAQGQGGGLVTAGQNVISNAGQLANSTIALGSQIYQPRQFGLQGSDLANISLSNTTGANNLAQYLYSTKVQGAQLNNQIAGANAGAAAQSQGNLISGGTSAAASAASLAISFAISCYVARECFSALDNRFYRWRFYLMNLAPAQVRSFYLRYARLMSWKLILQPEMKLPMRMLLEKLASQVPYAPAY